MSLRRPDNFQGERLTSFNIGSYENALYPVIKDISPRRKVDIIRNPNNNYSMDVFNSNSSISNNCSCINNTKENSNVTLKGLEDKGKLCVSKLLIY